MLNCDNADTPVPYIDLLNEILEYKVTAVTGQTVTFADGAATTGDAADLSTSRQILPAELGDYTTAYATLATTSYPWSLPFDRAAQEAIAHLSVLGVPAPMLMQTFTPPALAQPPAPPANPAATEAAAEIAAMTLGLLPRDRAIIVGKPIGGGPASPGSDWGLTSTSTWQTQLLVVGTFLNATGLAYADLLELLDASLFTPFLAAGVAGPTIGLITPLPGGSDCDPMNLTINGLDATKLTQLWPLVHRFLRLRGKLGVTTTELDKALAAFAGGQAESIDDPMLERLSVIMTIRSQLGTPIVEMLSWWSPVDRRPSPLSNQPSLFAQQFLNPALSDAVDDEALFAELADPTLPSTSAPAGSPSLSDHAARVAAGAQLSGSDYALLTDPNASPAVLGLSQASRDALLTRALLTLDNVSHVFRFASLARALKLAVGDLLQLRALSGVDPFNAADLTRTTSFVQIAQQVQASAFSVPQLAYLLRQLAPATSAFSLIPAQAASFLADPRAGRRQDRLRHGLRRDVAAWGRPHRGRPGGHAHDPGAGHDPAGCGRGRRPPGHPRPARPGDRDGRHPEPVQLPRDDNRHPARDRSRRADRDDLRAALRLRRGAASSVSAADADHRPGGAPARDDAQVGCGHGERAARDVAPVEPPRPDDPRGHRRLPRTPR